MYLYLIAMRAPLHSCNWDADDAADNIVYLFFGNPHVILDIWENSRLYKISLSSMPSTSTL